MKYLFLITLCFLVYANCLNNAFLSDDIPAIVNNPSISKIEWLNPYNTFNSICYLIGGKNPFAFHLVSILLHCLATCLVFAFLKGFFKPLTALFGASLFATHPIHTEAVTWVSGKPYIILTILALGIYFLCRKGKKSYVLALLLFTYFCISSVWQALLVAGFVVLTSVVFKKVKLLKSLSFFLIAIANLFISWSVVSHRVAYVAQEIGTKAWTNPIFNMAYSLFEHLRLLVYPARLTLYHEPPIITPFVLKIELIIMALIIPFLPLLWKKARIVFYALALFVLCLGVTFSPVMISWLVAERYLYLPVISLSLILCYLFERFKTTQISTYAFVLLIMVLSIRTVARNEDWKNANTFWRQTVAVSPFSPQARNNLGDMYANEGNIEMAKVEFSNAIRLRPKYAEAYHNLAVCYQRQGKSEEAQTLVKYALTLNPKLYEKN